MNFVLSRGYVLPVAVSVALHAALLLVLLIGWESAPAPKNVKKPNYVQAKLVKLEAQTKQAKPVEKKPKVVDLEKRRREQERLKKLEEQKRQQALQRKQEEQKKKAEAERKRKEQERKAKEAAERKKREEQQRREREIKAMEQALAAEQAELLETSYAQTAQSYMGAISQRIERNWSRPPSARNGMSCELRIQLVPTGRVVNVDVIKSSGNQQFDRSAVQAVEKAEQFPEIKDMPSEVFERYYRDLTLVFRPEDLRQ